MGQSRILFFYILMFSIKFLFRIFVINESRVVLIRGKSLYNKDHNECCMMLSYRCIVEHIC